MTPRQQTAAAVPDKRDHRQEVTDSIVRMLELGVAPWQKPWESAAIAWPSLPPRMLMKPRTVWACHPVRFMISATAAPEVPVLYLVADLDTSLPLDGMYEIFERAPPPKQMVIPRRADHLHFIDNAWRAAWSKMGSSPTRALIGGEVRRRRAVIELHLSAKFTILTLTQHPKQVARGAIADDKTKQLAHRFRKPQFP